jgi:hypothetical protein
MRTVAEQGMALMIPEGDPNEVKLLRQAIQVLLKLLFCSYKDFQKLFNLNHVDNRSEPCLAYAK